MNVTVFIERKTGAIAHVDFAAREQSAFGGPWGDPELTSTVSLEIPSEGYLRAVIPDGRGGAMLDPNWSPPVPEPTVEERLQIVEAKLIQLEKFLKPDNTRRGYP